MEEAYKCGYCGWLLNSQCENVFEHDCLKKIFKESLHQVICDNQRVLTVVMKGNGATVGATTEEENTLGSTWEELFIKSVQDRPPLYDLGLPLFERTNCKKNVLWQEISNLYGGKYSPTELQKKWRYLRDCYTRAKKKITQYKPSGSGSEGNNPTDPGFRHYELMRFIDDHSSQQTTISSVEDEPSFQPVDPSVPSTSKISPRSHLTNPSISTISTPASSSSTPTLHLGSTHSAPETAQKTPKRKKLDSSLESTIKGYIENVPQQDGVDGFLIRLGESLRRLPYRERSLIEIQILQLVYEAESKLD